MCDLCGDDHAACNCPMFSQLDHPAKQDEDIGQQLAYRSLPSWVQLEDGPKGQHLVVSIQRVAKFTRLGPLVAPHTPHLDPATSFPLKICHVGGGHTYLDLSRKWLCNWLSLVPPGSPSHRNLLACQVEDLIYYVVAEDIEVGSELRVWYAPFYQQKVKEELKALGNRHTLVDTTLLAPTVPLEQSGAKFPAESLLHMAPSLSRIVVGKDQITFTHSLRGGENDKYIKCSPAPEGTFAADRYFSNDIGPGKQMQMAASSSYLWENHIHGRKKDETSSQSNYMHYSHVNQTSTTQSIVLVNNRDSASDPEFVVTFTITAAEGNSNLCSSHNESYDSSIVQSEDCLLDADPLEGSPDSDRKYKSFQSATHKRKSFKLKEPKPDVYVADSHVVKQLPARALGAREPRPWSCKYCGSSFTKLLPFANHLKAHLMWVVGRCHVCKDCGGSFSSSVLLQRHEQAGHHHNNFQKASEALSDCRGSGDSSMKHELFSDGEEAVDDPGGKESKDGFKKISALPTELVEGPHGCQICSKHFHKAQYLLRHLRKHTGDFTCQFCLKVFARKEGLQKHTCPKGSHQKSLKCSVCARIFLNPDLLEQHYLKHKGNRKCTRCSRTFSNITSLERHVKTCPSVEISTFFKCNICGKDMTSERVLERHMRSHSRQYECEVCSKPYSNSTSLAQHVPLCRQSHQVASVGHVACEDCGKEFTDASAFRTHYVTHTHPFHCSCCNHRFRTRVGYEVHVCEVDQACDQCSAVFRSVQALNRHSAVHGPPPHTCASCRRAFYRKESLDRHVCNFEMDVKENPKQKEASSFLCSTCGAVLATRHSFNTHVRAAHGGSSARELHCEICGKQFHRKDLLRDHQAVHAPPSFPCPTCKKLFKTHKSLEVHSLLHVGIKRFVCKYCNKKFHQKVNLARHERSHMPRGAIKCQYCGTHCISTDDLKSHLLSHTLLQPDLSPEVKQQGDTADFVAKDMSIHGEDLQSFQRGEAHSADQKLEAECVSHSGTGTKREMRTEARADEQTFSVPDALIEPEQSERECKQKVQFKVEEKVETDMKDSPPSKSVFRTGLVHNSGIAPEICSDINVQPRPVSDSGIENHTTVIMPPRISNTGLSSNHQSLNGNYMEPGLPETESSESAKDGSSPHIYNFNTSEACHANIESNMPEEQFPQSDLVHTNSGASEHLTLCTEPELVEQVCLYESNSNNVSVTTATTHSLECHILGSEQIVESVVLIPDSPGKDC
ncbi:PR domain zinc finger protein 15-like isoform X2 [Procambarus clarkii]